MSCNIYYYVVLAIVSNSYPPLPGRLPTRYSPVRNSSKKSKLLSSAFYLHVLGTPPAFVLSQDQTLQTKPTKPGPNQPQTASQNPTSVQQSRKPDQAQPNPHNKEGQANQNKTSPKNHTQQTKVHHAQPPGPWHKKHDTLSSSQTTHPAGTRSSLLT